MRSCLMIAACTAALLAGCSPEDIDAQAKAEPVTVNDQRAAYVGKALHNFALMNSAGRTENGLTLRASGDVQASAATCAVYDGRGQGLFFAWPESVDRLSLVKIGQAARANGANTVAEWRGGALYMGEQPMELPPNCTVPVRKDGTPVIVMRVAVSSAQFAPFSREEKMTRACPEGYAGYSVFTRTVEYTTQGTTNALEWHLSDMGKCIAAPKVHEEVAHETMPAWNAGGATVIDEALRATVPMRCTRAKIAATGATTSSEKVINTCAESAIAERIPEPEPIPEPPVPPLPDTLVTKCDEKIVRLPSMSTVAGYTAALAPYKALLRSLHLAGAVSSTCITIRSDGLWPTWATFLTYNMLSPGTTSSLTRLYHARVRFEFVGNAATNTWQEAHVTPYGWQYDYRALPAQFYGTDPEHWLRAEFYATSVTVRTMDGRGYTQYAGPLSYLGAYRRHNLPIPYANKEGDPWGHTPEQAEAAHAISFAAFGNQRYNYEFAVGYPE